MRRSRTKSLKAQQSKTACQTTPPKPRLWSARVTRESHALELDPGVFTWTDPEGIALSLKRSAEESPRRKGSAQQSAMSMLTFYINRAGKNLPPGQKHILERAKVELRKLFEGS